MKKTILFILALGVALPAAAQSTPAYLPAKGGVLLGPTDEMLTNPSRSTISGNMITGKFPNYIWSGTIPGTSAWNFGSVNHFYQGTLYNDTVPGCWGFATGAACGNTEHAVMNYAVNINGGGGTNIQSVTANFFSVGDHIGSRNTILSFGGSIDGGGPEGTKGSSYFVGEATNTWTGAVASGHGGAAQTTLTTTCATDCGSGNFGIPASAGSTTTGGPASLGQGLWITDEQATVASGQIEATTTASGETPGTMTVNITSGASNLAVSTCEVTLTSNLNPTANPSGSGSQTLTFAVNDVAGTCTSGGLISFSGHNHEQAVITSVTAPSGGQQTITANIRLYHESASYAFENANSDAGLFADIVVNDSGTLKFPFEVLGVQSISGNTVVMWWSWWYAAQGFAPYAFPAGHMSLAAQTNASLTNAGGIVATSIGTSQAMLFNHASGLYISGASNAAFDGACTSATVSVTSNSNIWTLNCTQATSTGDTATGATITLTDPTNDNPYGNSRVNFYQGAAIVDAQDYSAPIVVNGVTNYPVDGLQFEVEPNEMTLAAGDALVEHHSTPQFHNAVDSVGVSAPVCYSCNGKTLQFNGIFANGGGTDDNNGYFVFNQTPNSAYQYFGGTMAPVPYLVLKGMWANLIYLDQPPPPENYMLYSPNCPPSPSSCTDGSYWYGLYQFQGNGGSNNAQYFPETNTMEWNGLHQFNSGLAAGNNGQFNVSSNGAVAEPSNSLNSGHTFTRHDIVSGSITPSSVAANTCAAQTATVTGLKAGDHVINRDVLPSFTAGLSLDGIIVTGANTVSMNWCNVTAAAIAPPTGTYTFDVEQ